MPLMVADGEVGSYDAGPRAERRVDSDAAPTKETGPCLPPLDFYVEEK